jgi:hypothetical protein
MARVRSTARVEREGDEAEAMKTVPISEAMKRSRLIESRLEGGGVNRAKLKFSKNNHNYKPG